MQFTVLEMTQSILSSLSSDEVNSIGDTAESLQIANILETVYYNIATRGNLPEHNGLLQLTGNDDPLKPTLMLIPNNVAQIDWLEYFDTNPSDGAAFQTDQFGSYSHDLNTDLQNNSTFQSSFPWSTTSTTSATVGTGTFVFSVPSGLTIAIGNECEILNGTTAYMSGIVISYFNSQLVINVTASTGSGTFASWTISQLNAPSTAPGYKRLEIITVHEFMKMTGTFNPQNSNVGQYQFSFQGRNFTVNYQNNTQPRYCCFIANQYVLFDNFDNTQDSCLQGSKTMAYGQFVPPFTLEDNFIPLLNDYQFPLLIAEAKSLAFYELKQILHQKAEQEAKRQWSNLQKNKSVVNKPSYFDQLPDFGRRLYTGGYSTGYPNDWTAGYNGAPW